MGYQTLYFRCVAYRKPSSGNPDKVPSVRVTFDDNGIPVPDENGTREALCRTCAETINQKREDEGLKPLDIPADAYEAAQVMP